MVNKLPVIPLKKRAILQEYIWFYQNYVKFACILLKNQQFTRLFLSGSTLFQVWFQIPNNTLVIDRIQYTVYGTLYTLQIIKYILQYALNAIQYTQYTSYYTLYNIQNRVYKFNRKKSIEYTGTNIQKRVLCTVYILLDNRKGIIVYRCTAGLKRHVRPDGLLYNNGRVFLVCKRSISKEVKEI